MTNRKNNKKIIRVGSRKSELALIQTKYVIGLLQKMYPNTKFEIHTMSTIGDRVLNISLPKIGEKSLFTRDLEDSLRNGGVDFVVHSLKDLPTTLPHGMVIGAVLERDDARDALVLRPELSQHTIDTLPEGSIIGTSSLRRTAQIRRLYPHLKVCDIRGNLNTRLAKLDAADSKFAGIVLAQAGLVRMGWLKRITQVLEPSELLYAVGQGALAVECRSNDDQVLGMLQRIMCLTTTCRILSERSFLRTLGGGCSAPVAVRSALNGDANGNHEQLSLDLIGAVWSLDGSTELRDQLACSLHLPASPTACPKGGRRKNGNNNEEEENSLEQPPQKRAREGDSDESSSTSPATEERSSPTVYNDDETLYANILQSAVVPLTGQKESNGCPIKEAANNNGNGTDNGNGNNNNANGNGKVTPSDGGGDADCPTDGPSCSTAWRLPLAVGQEVMGQCPFDDKTRAKLLEMGLVPQPQQGGDVTDNAAALLLQKPLTAAHADPNADISKCPFVNLIEYADDAKPQPQEVPTLSENADVLFCGLYQHACYERELYARCERLGQQLAEQLIQKGALDIMHKAQAEIHGKA